MLNLVVSSSDNLFFKFFNTLRQAPALSRYLPGKRILLACLPKSGSTFVASKLASLPNFRQVHYMHHQWTSCTEEQQMRSIYIAAVSIRHLGKNLVAQHHVNCSLPQEEVIKASNLKVILLYRNFKDSLLSYADHIFNVHGPAGYYGYPIWNSPFFDPLDCKKLLEKQNISLLDAVTRSLLPSYVRMYLSWSNMSDSLLESSSSPLRISYENLISDKYCTFRSILDHCEIDVPKSILESTLASSQQETRFNKGIAGRGIDAFDHDPEALLSYNRIIDCFSSESLKEVI